MPESKHPRVVIFAGPNGAGKSTHADDILAALRIETFVNADYIARGLSGRNTETVSFEAGRIMLKRLRQLAEAHEDFAFESTLSSRSFAPFLRKLIDQGYSLSIYYFSLASAQLAVRRVKLRVALGGHGVPSDIVKRRYVRSLQNFMTLYAPLASRWTIFDNSALEKAQLIALQEGERLTIKDKTKWMELNTRAKGL